MGWKDWFKAAPVVDTAIGASARSAVHPSLVAQTIGDNFVKLNQEGYTNPMVKACVELLANNISRVPPVLTLRGKKYYRNPIDDQEAMPKAWASFFENWQHKMMQAMRYRLVHGYAIMNTSKGANYNLSEVLPVTDYQVTVGDDGLMREIIVTSARAYGTQNERKIERSFKGELLKGVMLWLDQGTVGDRYRAQSPVLLAGKTVDAHNACTAWLNTTCRRGGSFSGMFFYDGDGADGGMGPKEIEEFKKSLMENASGAENAGKPAVISGKKMGYKDTGGDPKSMMIDKVKDSLALDICAHFGVPPQLVGLKGAATYANVSVAQQILYVNRIDALLASFYEELTTHLCRQFGDSKMKVEADRSQIDALQDLRDTRAQKVNSLAFLTINEKRKAYGLEPIEGGDELATAVGSMDGEDKPPEIPGNNEDEPEPPEPEEENNDT